MLLLGVLAAQAEGAVAGGAAYDLLETEILTGTQASVTFSNLNSTYGSTYQHLQLRMAMRGTRSSALDYTEITFNSDTGANYSGHALQGNGSTVTSSSQVSTNYVYFGAMPANSALANSFSVSVADILDPFETTKATTTRALWGLTETTWKLVNLSSGAWHNNNAVDSITIALEVGPNFAIGSRFSLYGLKAA